MREAVLYQRLGNTDLVQCNVCQWHCRILPGHLGHCRVRQNRDGVLFDLLYAQVAAAHVDPVEKKPLFHFHPGSQVFSLGTVGCNFRCRHCQNWELAFAAPSEIPPSATAPVWKVGDLCQQLSVISPEQAVALTERQHCEGICWTYNEPTIWFEYTLECAKLAKERGLYTAYVTNGFMSEEALDMIGPYLDAFRVDIKGFDDAVYRRLAKITRWRRILDTTLRAKERWGMHVEVVTNVIPTLNDDEQLQELAEWIGVNLGTETPWHVTGFHPDALLRGIPATSAATLMRARQVGLSAGLHFVYTGNMPGTGGEDTRCPSCGRTAIRREGYRTELVAVARGGLCASCGAGLNIRGIG